MATSFATGFSAGQRGYQQVLDNDRQKEIDARAAKEFARREVEWARADAQRAQEDAAFQDYNDLQTSGKAVGMNASGFSDGSARMLYGNGGQGAVDEAASYANVENRRFGLPTTNTTSGGADPSAPSVPTVSMRRATPLDRIRGLEGVALARRDVQSLERLGSQRQEEEESQFIADALKSYTGADEQIGATAQYLNTKSQRISLGEPDKKGFVQIAVVKPDGRAEFVNLTRQDQAQLYAAGLLMERNPTKALAMMSGVNKELAAAVDKENGITAKLATNTNDVANKRGGLAIQQQNANTSRMNANSMAAYRNAAGAAAGARGAGKPVKMSVTTTDEITGKPTKVEVFVDPTTHKATTADGRPFEDSKALDRAMGVWDKNARLDAAEANDLQLIEGQVRGGHMPMDQLEAGRDAIRMRYEVQRAQLAFKDMSPDERTGAIRQLAGSGAKPADVAKALGVSVETVNSALKGVKKESTMAPRDIRPNPWDAPARNFSPQDLERMEERRVQREAQAAAVRARQEATTGPNTSGVLPRGLNMQGWTNIPTR